MSGMLDNKSLRLSFGRGTEGKPSMDGKQYFRACCQQAGLNCAEVFKLGEQSSMCYGGYVYHCPIRLRGPSHRYAVNYIAERDVYVAWSLNVPGAEKKTVFRVLKKELADMPQGQVRVILKKVYGCEARTESVYAFDRAAVTTFLQTFVLKPGTEEDAPSP